MNENYKNLAQFRGYIRVGMVFKIKYHAYLGDKLKDHALGSPRVIQEIKSKRIGFKCIESVSYLYLTSSEFKATRCGFDIHEDGKLIISYEEINNKE